LPGLTVMPNWSMRAAHSRAASVLRGAFSRRQMVDCEASAAPLWGQRPTASFIKDHGALGHASADKWQPISPLKGGAKITYTE
jgi:hypothetical protein